MASCSHKGIQKFIPDNVLANLPDCQSGVGRHKCAICAYHFGLTNSTTIGPVQSCDASHASAPLAMLSSLQETQAGLARHKCCYSAYQAGLSAKITADALKDFFPDGDLSGDEADLVVNEIKRYVIHRKIERNANASSAVKKHHGYTCKACNFNFSLRYGQLGKDFIEAHHLKPLSKLKENEVASYDVKSDFTVLCSNCHRMVHRQKDVSDIAGLKALVDTKHEKS